MTNKDLKYFNVARKIANLSDFKRFHLGCVAVYNGKYILATGYCSSKTLPIQAHYNQYRNFDGYLSPARSHAEMNVLQKLKQMREINYRNVVLYVWRNLVNGEQALSRPCNSCYMAMLDIGIRGCWYSCDDGFKYEVIR